MMKRSTKASFLLVLICAQAAFASPIGKGLFAGLTKGADCDGMCKPAVTPAKLGAYTVECPAGYTAEKDKLGVLHCIKRQKLACPKNFKLSADGQTCCPDDNQCFPTAYALCPSGYVPKATCPKVSFPIPGSSIADILSKKDTGAADYDFSKVLPEGKGYKIPDIPKLPEVKIPDLPHAPKLPKLPNLEGLKNLTDHLPKKAPELPAITVPNFKLPDVQLPQHPTPNVTALFEKITAAKPAKAQAAKTGRKLQQAPLGAAAAAAALLTPAVNVNAEVLRPVVILPKPVLSMNVPQYYTEVKQARPPRFQPPIVILPQPALSFIEPKIDVTLPRFRIPRPDRIVPVLPQPRISFLPPDLKTSAGGFRLKQKFVAVDATRLGPRTTVDLNIPPVRIPNMNPLNVEVKPPPRVIVDLSQFGPHDATVVKLPKINVTVPQILDIKRNDPRVRFINLGRFQSGPLYEFKLPGLPERNKINIDLPKINMSTVVLPGWTEKEVIGVNVQPPDYPPTHQVKLTVDMTNATYQGLPRTVRVTPVGDLRDTNVQLVTMPPVKIPTYPPFVTIDMRNNDTLGIRDQNLTRGDLDVVAYKLPTLPRMGRDINIKLGTVNVDRWLPVRSAPGDVGQLKETVTLVNATIPSFNRIEALNKPFINPANVTFAFNGTKETGPWSLFIGVQDELSGGKGKATPINIREPFGNESALIIARDAVRSVLPGTASGQFCRYKCCPECKPVPEKILYAEPLVKCEAGCSYDKVALKCVCAPEKTYACPAGKKSCDLPGFATGLCIDAAKHATTCIAHGAVCLAQNKVQTCKKE